LKRKNDNRLDEVKITLSVNYKQSKPVCIKAFTIIVINLKKTFNLLMSRRINYLKENSVSNPNQLLKC